MKVDKGESHGYHYFVKHTVSLNITPDDPASQQGRAMTLLNMENPVFVTYMIAAALMILKIMNII